MVRDLDEAQAQLARAGVGTFERGLSATVFDREMYGKPARDAEVRGAVAQMGPLEFELLQPIQGASLAGEALASRGEGAVHICGYTDDLPGEIAAMRSAGFEAISTGSLEGGGRYAFFDTQEIGGLVLGLFDPRAP